MSPFRKFITIMTEMYITKYNLSKWLVTVVCCTCFHSDHSDQPCIDHSFCLNSNGFTVQVRECGITSPSMLRFLNNLGLMCCSIHQMNTAYILFLH